jgi:hypothetical protein
MLFLYECQKFLQFSSGSIFCTISNTYGLEALQAAASQASVFALFTAKYKFCGFSTYVASVKDETTVRGILREEACGGVTEECQRSVLLTNADTDTPIFITNPILHIVTIDCITHHAQRSL